MGSFSFIGRALIDGEVRPAAVRVQDGLIQGLRPTTDPGAGTVVELNAKQILLPAAIDMLAAARDWGEVHRDTVETVTKAALAGGITVLCDQPNTMPRINTPELVARRATTFAQQSYVDYGLQTHPPHEDVSLAPKLREAGAFGLTFFQWEFPPWNYPHDIDRTKERMGRYAAAGLLGMGWIEELAMRSTPLEPDGERWAMDQFLRRLHPDFSMRAVVTLAESVKKLADAKQQFPNLYLQTAPHYLCMSQELATERIGCAALNSPPLRSRENLAELHKLAADGVFDVFASLHQPHRTLSVGEILVDDPRVALVSATGSTAMGRAVGPGAMQRFGRSLLELGGNNAAIVCPSADLDLAVRAISFSAIGTAGQRCSSLRRL